MYLNQGYIRKSAIQNTESFDLTDFANGSHLPIGWREIPRK